MDRHILKIKTNHFVSMIPSSCPNLSYKSVIWKKLRAFLACMKTTFSFVYRKKNSHYFAFHLLWCRHHALIVLQFEVRADVTLKMSEQSWFCVPRLRQTTQQTPEAKGLGQQQQCSRQQQQPWRASLRQAEALPRAACFQYRIFCTRGKDRNCSPTPDARTSFHLHYPCITWD